MKIKAIIFDFSGTLDNLDEIRLSAVEKSLLEIRKEIEPEKILEEAKEVIVEIFRLDTEMQSASIKEIFQEAIKIKYPEILKDKIEKMWDIYNGERKKRRDILESFLKNFETLSKYKLFILTRSSADMIRETLEKHGKAGFFEIYRTKKPSTETLREIMEKHSLKPEECIMTGDDVTLDLMPAKMLGMKTILRSSYVDYFITDYNNIDDIL